ncbi:MAG: M20/M25/M40 family metallo-hydrolase [bacterium]|nr:MAG: M20/M25/M40 family metallo-hydrolase [bacterium]
MTYPKNTLVILLAIFTILSAQPDSVFYDPKVDSLIGQVNSANISQYISDLANANGYSSRVTFTPGNLWSATYIKQAFDALPGLSSVEYDTFYVLNAPLPWNVYPLVNVIATITGTGPANRYYVVGGHFDNSASLDPNINWSTQWDTAIAPGADDNASGVAAVLEIARILSDPNNQFQPEVTIKFVAFGAEESSPVTNINHRGSNHFVTSAASQMDDILGVYNIDMIGYNNTGNHYYNIVSNTNSMELGDDLVQANLTYQIGINSNSNPFVYATYSDHEQFWQYGYKAILLIENAPPWNNNPPWYNANPYYHKATDTPDKVNIDQVTKITQATLAAVACRTVPATSLAQNLTEDIFPENYILQQNYPNPFNAHTIFNYVLNSSAQVKIKIYNAAGQKVAEIQDAWQSAGEHRVNWQAKDDNGNTLPSGLYFAHFTFNHTVKTQKVMLIR